MWARITLAACLALSFATVTLIDSTPSVAAETPQGQKFHDLLAQWKQLIAKLRHIAEQYPSTPASNKPAVEAEYNAMVGEGRKLAPALVAAAEQAFLAAPNEDKVVSEFLTAQVTDNMQSDNYEEAARLSQLLVDHGYKSGPLFSAAATAALNVGNLEQARKYAELAGNSQELLDQIAKYEPLLAKERQIRAAEAQADDLPRVKLSTSKGDIVIELFENEAPNATANFISLIEKKFYDGVKFHRVIPGFMAQGGDPTGTGSGGPGYTIACECYRPDYRVHFRGTLSMAHAGRDTGGSQFFLTFVPTAHLDGRHTAFGRVIEGMDVLAKLQRINPGEGGTPDKILSATVVRKRNHPYEPVKGPGR